MYCKSHSPPVGICNPRLQAVRQATCDTLYDNGSPSTAVISVTRPGLATKIEAHPASAIPAKEIENEQAPNLPSAPPLPPYPFQSPAHDNCPV